MNNRGQTARIILALIGFWFKILNAATKQFLGMTNGQKSDCFFSETKTLKSRQDALHKISTITKRTQHAQKY